MKFTILGSGTPAPSLTRQSSGYILEIGDDLIVFDHGGGAHQRLLEAGYKAADVTHFFLTHYHYDHTLDVPRLILTRWDHGNEHYRVMSGSHLDNAETAKQAGVGTLVLTHLQPDLDRFGVREHMVAEMAEIYTGCIVVGEDLMQVPMAPTKHSTAD